MTSPLAEYEILCLLIKNAFILPDSSFASRSHDQHLRTTTISSLFKASFYVKKQKLTTTGRLRYPTRSLSPLLIPPRHFHRPRELLPPPHNLQRNLDPHRNRPSTNTRLPRCLIWSHTPGRSCRCNPRGVRPRRDLSPSHPSWSPCRRASPPSHGCCSPRNSKGYCMANSNWCFDEHCPPFHKLSRRSGAYQRSFDHGRGGWGWLYRSTTWDS
jgi:hypothetical protein